MRLFISLENGTIVQSESDPDEDQIQQIDNDELDVFEFRPDGFYRAVVVSDVEEVTGDDGEETTLKENPLLDWEKVEVR